MLRLPRHSKPSFGIGFPSAAWEPAKAVTNLWNGKRDAAKLCEGLDEQDTAMRLALHLIAHPEEVEEMMT